MCTRVALMLVSFLAAGSPQLDAQAVDLEQLLAQAIDLHQAGRLEEAVLAYEKFLSQRPQVPQVLSNLGAAYSGLGNYEKAIESYKRALAWDEKNLSIRLNLAIAYYKAADLDRSIEQLEKVMQADPHNQKAALLLADCHFRRGEYRRVVETLSPFSARAGEDLAIAYLLGTALIRENRLQEGQRMVDHILRKGDLAEAHLMMGTAYQMAGEYPRAAEEFQKAVGLNPRLPGAHSLLGRALLFIGEREQAAQAFARELESNPNDFDANFYSGLFLKEEHRYEVALTYFERCRRLRPRALEVDYQVALIYLATGEAEKARGLLEWIVGQAPDFVEAQVSLATAFYRLGMKEAGDRQREIVLRLNAERQAKQPGSQEQLGPAYRGNQTFDAPRPPAREKPR